MVYFTSKATFRHTTRSILFDIPILFQTRKKKITTQQTYHRCIKTTGTRNLSAKLIQYKMNLSLLELQY
jgi:hypothetical protein